MSLHGSTTTDSDRTVGGLSSLFRRVRSLRLGQKLALTYVLGIFIPLALANGFVLRNVTREAREQEEAFMLATVERVKDAISREFEPIETVSEFVYTDSAIYRILSGTFDRFEDYIAVHGDYLTPALTKYVNVFPGIARMIVYTENQIVRVSAGYLRINDYTTNSSWYGMLESAASGFATLVHVDRDPRSEITQRSYISVFRDLNNPTFTREGRLILRIDVNPGTLVRHLDSGEFVGQLRLIDPRGTVAVESIRPATLDDPFVFDSAFNGSGALSGWRLRGELGPQLDVSSWSIRWTRLLVVSGLSIAVTSLVILALSRSLTTRLESLREQMRKVEREDFSPITLTGGTHDEIHELMVDYNLMAGKVDTLINDGYKMELEQNRLLVARQQAELNALQSQVNPHFLYNVLESIRMKSHIKGERETAEVIKKLSRAFRRITSWDEDLIPVTEEMSCTRDYLEIQRYRFGERLQASITLDPRAETRLVPKLTIQALVENACVHGLEPTKAGGRVEVEVHQIDARLTVRIADDGVGCDAEAIRSRISHPDSESRHVGIANAYRRLQLHFGERFTFSFTSRPGVGTTVVIEIGDTDATS